MVGCIMVIYRSQCRRTTIDQVSSGGPGEPERGTGDTQAPPKKPTSDEVLSDTLVISLPQRPSRTNKCSHALLHAYIFMSMCNYFLLPYTGLMHTVAGVSWGDVSFLCFLLSPLLFCVLFSAMQTHSATGIRVLHIKACLESWSKSMK